MSIEDFIKNDDYFDRYQFYTHWNDFTVYDIWRKADEGACVGYPHYALEKDGVIRIATLEETRTMMNYM